MDFHIPLSQWNFTMRHKSIPIVYQLEANECGPACLTMVLKYFGHHVPLSEIRAVCGVGRDGVTALTLHHVAQKYGLQSQALRVPIAQLPELKIPAILHWGKSHFVVLEQVKWNGVWIVDPARGRQFILLEEFVSEFGGIALQLQTTVDFTKRANESFTYWQQFGQILISKKRWLLGLVVPSIVLQVLALLLPFFTQWVTDSIIPNENNTFLPIMLVASLLLLLFQGAFLLLRSFLLIRLQMQLDRRLMELFFKHLLNLPFNFFQHRSNGDLLIRMQTMTWLRDLVTSYGATLLLDSFFLVTYLFILLYINRQMSMVVLLIAGIQLTLMIVLSPFIQKATRHDLEKQARFQAYALEILSAINLVKAQAFEDTVFENWQTQLEAHLQSNQHRNQINALSDALVNALRWWSPVVLLLIGTQSVLSGQMTLGTMLGFNAIALFFLNPLATLVTLGRQLQVMSAAMQRIQDIMQTKIEDLHLKEASTTLSGNIELKDVTFAYHAEAKPVLKLVSVSIDAGKMLAIVGRTGSGKSTLLRLLLGLHLPTEGTICYDNSRLSEMNLQALRRQIAYVPQLPYFFNASIAANIALLQSSASMSRIIQVTKIAQIHDDIMDLPLQYNTIISENNSNFSGGQLQRMALARALLNEPRILLLDEATSHLDYETERAININLKQMNCTRVVIAHNLQTIQYADKIIVLNNGSIAEIGTHNELLHLNEHYASLYASKSEDI